MTAIIRRAGGQPLTQTQKNSMSAKHAICLFGLNSILLQLIRSQVTISRSLECGSCSG